jgi:hypothetical protein
MQREVIDRFKFLRSVVVVAFLLNAAFLGSFEFSPFIS